MSRSVNIHWVGDQNEAKFGHRKLGMSPQNQQDFVRKKAIEIQGTTGQRRFWWTGLSDEKSEGQSVFGFDTLFNNSK